MCNIKLEDWMPMSKFSYHLITYPFRYHLSLIYHLERGGNYE